MHNELEACLFFVWTDLPPDFSAFFQTFFIEAAAAYVERLDAQSPLWRRSVPKREGLALPQRDMKFNAPNGLLRLELALEHRRQ